MKTDTVNFEGHTAALEIESSPHDAWFIQQRLEGCKRTFAYCYSEPDAKLFIAAHDLLRERNELRAFLARQVDRGWLVENRNEACELLARCGK